MTYLRTALDQSKKKQQPRTKSEPTGPNSKTKPKKVNVSLPISPLRDGEEILQDALVIRLKLKLRIFHYFNIFQKINIKTLPPNIENRTTILNGMTSTIKLRLKNTLNKTFAEILTEFPHYMSYNGELVSSLI